MLNFLHEQFLCKRAPGLQVFIEELLQTAGIGFVQGYLQALGGGIAHDGDAVGAWWFAQAVFHITQAC